MQSVKLFFDKLAGAKASTRVYFASLLLVGVTLLSKLSERPGIDDPAFVPVEEFSALPMDLGSWKGERSEVIDALSEATGAKVALDRIYTGPEGQVVYVHVAAFDHFRQLAHHHPRVCYGAAGWQPVRSQLLEIPGSRSEVGAQSCELITFANRTEQVYVLYWYQVGKNTTIRPEGVRALWWQVRNFRPLPPQVKVLMQASAPDEEAARSAMLELAGIIYSWVTRTCDPENLKNLVQTKRG